MTHSLNFVEKPKGKKLAEILEPFNENTDDERYLTKVVYCKNGDYWHYYETKLLPTLAELLMEDNPKLKDSQAYWQEKIDRFANARGDDKQLKDLLLEYEGGKCDENGNLYWLDPENAKWDWWLPGGRWNNWLRTKNGKNTNHAKRGEIDLNAMLLREVGHYRDRYNELKASDPLWYENLDYLNSYSPDTTIDDYIKSLGIQVKPYGFLSNGKWLDYDNTENYEQEFDRWWENLDPDAEIYAIDCHI